MKKVQIIQKIVTLQLIYTCGFTGELKMVLALLTGLEPKQQRLLFKGKEREDDEYLHMVGVGEKDKVLLLEDPAFKEKKLLNNISTSCPTIIV